MRWLLALAAVVPCLPALADTAPPPRPVEYAVVESSLPTAGGRIRQFAFDADPATYFASDRNATRADHLTLTFDHPIALKSVAVLTGRPGGEDALSGVLELSADGGVFETAATFANGKAEAVGKGRKIKAV